MMAWDREKERSAARKMSVGSCIFALCFSIFWCIMAAASGGWFMLLFGIPFAVFMAYRLKLCLEMTKNDKKKSADPWDRPAESRDYTRHEPTTWDHAPHEPTGSSGDGYCPYCGEQTQEGFVFCPKCGRRL